MKTISLLLLSLALAPALLADPIIGPTTAFKKVPWTPLFNGKDFSGWKQVGGKAKYEVGKNASVIGTSVAKTPNSFLTTEKEYANFILEYDFKVDPELNSGVQIRSHSRPDYRKGRFHGYQVEIDTNPERARFWTAGIYEEGRRGWLFPKKGDKEMEAAFTKQGAKLTKTTDWNKVRVEAIGNRIRTFLNGECRADLTDSDESSGLIGLQVHGIPEKNAGKTVQWKNLRIKVLPDDATFPEVKK